ncbi:Hypothetical protein DHA2_150959 [Giardia duodenalis]|uniref:Uncharacterized protein n=1 Tax=Giardia intestinalis TaxID=5741 RepID=V6TJJ8_GIAIN|nr:Hypothetical protein DHA2_150959 [Giardia intestinalis]
MEDEYAVGKALSGVSPQLLASRLCPPQHRSMLGAPRDRVQGCSVAQPEEGLDAAPRDGAHSPGRGRLLLGCSLCRARPPCPSVCISLYYANATMCSRWNAVCSVSGRPVSGSPGGSGLPCGAHHDRPLIVVVLSRSWEEGRTKVLLPPESLDTHLRTLDLDLGW